MKTFKNCKKFVSLIIAGGISHSLSWHRKGDRNPNIKLYARLWTPEDPRGNRISSNSLSSLHSSSSFDDEMRFDGNITHENLAGGLYTNGNESF